MSPEVMPYLINLTKGFTKFNARTALSLKSKYTQKFYELCCEYSGDFRYQRANPDDRAFKKNVLPVHIETLRRLFGIDDQIDERTGKIKVKGKYANFTNFKRNVVSVAQEELYELYHSGNSEVWFDCVPFQRTGRKVTAVVLFIYSKENPKQGLPKIWQEGDEALNPYEDFPGTKLQEAKPTTPVSSGNDSVPSLLQKVRIKLSPYLEDNEISYYIDFIRNSGWLDYESCMQVIQVIEEKERQPKFKGGTKSYKKKSITHYALQENLKEFGWSIPEPKISRYCTA